MTLRLRITVLLFASQGPGIFGGRIVTGNSSERIRSWPSSKTTTGASLRPLRESDFILSCWIVT